MILNVLAAHAARLKPMWNSPLLCWHDGWQLSRCRYWHVDRATHPKINERPSQIPQVSPAVSPSPSLICPFSSKPCLFLQPSIMVNQYVLWISVADHSLPQTFDMRVIHHRNHTIWNLMYLTNSWNINRSKYLRDESRSLKLKWKPKRNLAFEPTTRYCVHQSWRTSLDFG